MTTALILIAMIFLATWGLMLYELAQGKKQLQTENRLKTWYIPFWNKFVEVEVYKNELFFYLIKPTTNTDFGYRINLGMWINGEWFYNDDLSSTRAFNVITKRYSNRINELQKLSRAVVS